MSASTVSWEQVAWWSLLHQLGIGCVHGRTKTWPATLCPWWSLVFLFLFCVCVYGIGLCTATENLWFTCGRMIKLIPELPLAQCWKNVTQEFSGNLEHLELSQKWRIWFYMENHGEDLNFPILAVCSCLVKFLWKFSFIIQLCYIKLLFSREWEDVSKTLRLGISWLMVVNGLVWMLSSTWSRMLICWSWCLCEIFDSSSWHQDTVLLFGRALSGQTFWIFAFYFQRVCCWLGWECRSLYPLTLRRKERKPRDRLAANWIRGWNCRSVQGVAQVMKCHFVWSDIGLALEALSLGDQGQTPSHFKAHLICLENI